jgi:hypothetical protein
MSAPRRLGAVLACVTIVATAAACSPSHSSATPTATLGSQPTLPRTRGYTCHDPKGDIAVKTNAVGNLSQPAGVDILLASALVEGNDLVVHFTQAGPIAPLNGPLFDVEQGDISANPDLSFELRAEPDNNTNADTSNTAPEPTAGASRWSVTLYSYQQGNQRTTDLSVPVTVSGNTLNYSVPLSKLPAIVSLQWQFGVAAYPGGINVPFDDCSSFSASTTTSTS